MISHGLQQASASAGAQAQPYPPNPAKWPGAHVSLGEGSKWRWSLWTSTQTGPIFVGGIFSDGQMWQGWTSVSISFMLPLQSSAGPVQRAGGFLLSPGMELSCCSLPLPGLIWVFSSLKCSRKFSSYMVLFCIFRHPDLPMFNHRHPLKCQWDAT